jgi:hypothetical protein
MSLKSLLGGRYQTAMVGQSARSSETRWREQASTFERPSAYGGCTLKPITGEAIFWKIK